MNIQEAISDNERSLNELVSFHEQSKVDRNRTFLDTEIRRLRSKIDELKKSLESDKPVIRYKTIENYSWEQTDSLIKIYLSIDIFKNTPTKDQIKIELRDQDQTAIITVDNARLVIKNLNSKVSVDLDNIGRVTKNFVIVNLKKNDNMTWPSLQKSAKAGIKDDLGPLGGLNDGPGANDDPSQSMMNLMKKMYQDGDDEMKRMINKAWSENSMKNKFA